MSADVRDEVLAVVEQGELPAGGPSELAARGLAKDAPARYFQHWAREAAVRVRVEARRPVCRCPTAVTTPSGRCERCRGWR
jgi:hypothetical protein